MRAYIADFGLSTLLDSGSAAAVAGSAIMGTPRWLALEIIPHAGVKQYHTHATDIYVFELVCYEASHTPLQLRNPV
jgi:Protein tyrosine and serine/threonine kinase